MGRQACCDKGGLKRGPWTIEEDHKLMNFILNNGIQCWRMVPKLAGLLRCGKSCRLRWINYLRPDLIRGALSEAEENQIIQLHARLGNRWSKIASHIPGRTDNEIKNHWNTRIRKRLKQQGIDPVTHNPIQQNDKVQLEDHHQTMATEQASSSNINSLHNDLPNETANFENEVAIISHDTINDPNIDYSPSFSIDSISTHDQQPLQQGVDSFDSFLAWNYFNQFDEEIFFSQKPLF